MPISAAAVDKFIQLLNAARPVTHRKMFGGLGIYQDGVFFAVLDNDRLYFKSDAVTDPEFDRFDADSWVIDGDPPSVMPYREVPNAVCSDPGKLAAWIEASVAVASRKKAAPRKKKP